MTNFCKILENIFNLMYFMFQFTNLFYRYIDFEEHHLCLAYLRVIFSGDLWGLYFSKAKSCLFFYLYKLIWLYGFLFFYSYMFWATIVQIIWRGEGEEWLLHSHSTLQVFPQIYTVFALITNSLISVFGTHF